MSVRCGLMLIANAAAMSGLWPADATAEDGDRKVDVVDHLDVIALAQSSCQLGRAGGVPQLAAGVDLARRPVLPRAHPERFGDDALGVPARHPCLFRRTGQADAPKESVEQIGERQRHVGAEGDDAEEDQQDQQ